MSSMSTAGRLVADHHFGRLALFLSLFTNITEGPISRYGQLAGQAFEGHRADYRQFTFGAQLILWGLFSEMVLADRAALLVSTVFGSPSDYSGGVADTGDACVYTCRFMQTLQGAWISSGAAGRCLALRSHGTSLSAVFLKIHR